MRQTAYYDSDAGIVYIGVLPPNRRRRGSRQIVSDDYGWGLIDYEDRAGGEVCGAGFWRPEEIFPRELLEALPHPTFTPFERRRMALRDRWDWATWIAWKRRRWERRLNSPEGLEARSRQESPRRWYRGRPGPPGMEDARSDVAWQP
jgi:uncharacterized protein YuzE